jgi:trimeric autotransporter adhesin
LRRQAEEKKVVLDWTTASEINVDYFDVQRSQNGVDFYTIGQVRAAGNSTQLKNYTKLDEQPLQGLSYYRLNTVDFDGSHKYSAIRPVYFSGTTANAYLVHEENRWGIIYAAAVDKSVKIEVLDASGKRIDIIQQAPTDGVIYLQHHQLPKGLYFISLSDGHQSTVLKAIR